MRFSCYFLFIFFTCINAKRMSDNNSDTLQLVHILFRHGDKTNEPVTTYPNDPYINNSYYPIGLGELTNKGKKRVYRLGKAIRDRYDKFLGKIYSPDLIEGISSNVNRTKASLQLVLASLFPPIGNQIWERGLNWQPIPFNAIPVEQDKIFWGIFCKKFEKAHSDYLKSPKFLEELEKDREMFEYMSEKSGWNITTYSQVYFLYAGLKCEKEADLTLPNWTKQIYPKPLEDIAIKSYYDKTANTELKTLASGFLLKKILDDSRSKIQKALVPKTRKLFLYAGHETNLAFTLLALDMFKPHIPPYASYILFELHKIRDIYGFKIYYQDYSGREPQLLQIPACEQFCAFDKFVSLMEEHLPNEDSCN